MADLVVITDFIGDFALSQDINTETRFDSIRDDWDRPFIRKLLGVELGNLFLTNWDAVSGVPANLDARFKSIYNAFQLDYAGSIVESKGMKYMLKGVVWFYYARQNNINIAPGGNKTSLAENAETSDQSFPLIRNYNAAVKTGKAIQFYIQQNSSTYPEYNGQYLDFISL